LNKGGRSLTRYRALLLDADGTIFDYDRGEEFALEKTLQDFSFEGEGVDLLTLYRRINKKIWKEFEQGSIKAGELKIERFRRFSAELGIDFDPEKFSNIYLDHLAQAAFMLPGAREVLEGLKDDYTMVLLTNGLSGVQRSRVRLAGVGEYFRELVISEEVGEAKPAPGIFARALKAAGNPALEEALMVGDSLESDILGGSRFGLDTCWLRGGEREIPEELSPTYIIDEISQLPAVLEGRG